MQIRRGFSDLNVTGTCRISPLRILSRIALTMYHGLMIALWNGQTLGRRACGIKVISVDGTYPTLGQSFGRTLAEILSALTPMVGYLMVPFDNQKRALHDRIAGTLVVHAIS